MLWGGCIHPLLFQRCWMLSPFPVVLVRIRAWGCRRGLDPIPGGLPSLCRSEGGVPSVPLPTLPLLNSLYFRKIPSPELTPRVSPPLLSPRFPQHPGKSKLPNVSLNIRQNLYFRAQTHHAGTGKLRQGWLLTPSPGTAFPSALFSCRFSSFLSPASLRHWFFFWV